MSTETRRWWCPECGGEFQIPQSQPDPVLCMKCVSQAAKRKGPPVLPPGVPKPVKVVKVEAPVETRKDEPVTRSPHEDRFNFGRVLLLLTGVAGVVLVSLLAIHFSESRHQVAANEVKPAPGQAVTAPVVQEKPVVIAQSPEQKKSDAEFQELQEWRKNFDTELKIALLPYWDIRVGGDIKKIDSLRERLKSLYSEFEAKQPKLAIYGLDKNIPQPEPACEFCKGKGKSDCPACIDGKLDCAGCTDGWIRIGGDQERCPLCDGRAKLKCTICNGKGEAECTFCNGHGHK